MSLLANRGLRLALGFVFIFGAVTFAAPRAQAQWDLGAVCISPTDVPELFSGDFSGLDNCESLCKKTAAYCRKFVKDAGSCQHTNNKGYYSILNKAECENLEDPAEKADCKDFVKEFKALVADDIKTDVSEMLDACDDYEAACIDDCSMVVE